MNRLEHEIPTGSLIGSQKKLELKRGSYGPFGSVAKNGCGFVALYNLYVLLGRAPSALKLLEDIRRHWLRTTLLGGLLGTSPFYILSSLRALNGVHLTWYWNIGRQKLPGKHDAYLIFYLYGFGAHYAVAEEKDGSLLIHNDWQASNWPDYLKKTKSWTMTVAGIDQTDPACP